MWNLCQAGVVSWTAAEVWVILALWVLFIHLSPSSEELEIKEHQSGH